MPAAQTFHATPTAVTAGSRRPSMPTTGVIAADAMPPVAVVVAWNDFMRRSAEANACAVLSAARMSICQRAASSGIFLSLRFEAAVGDEAVEIRDGHRVDFRRQLVQAIRQRVPVVR